MVLLCVCECVLCVCVCMSVCMCVDPMANGKEGLFCKVLFCDSTVVYACLCLCA